MIREFGEDGWLLHTDAPLAVAAALADAGLDDVVPSEHAVLLRGAADAVQAALRALPDELPTPASRPVLELPATWDGEDLEDVANAAGLTTEAVVAQLLNVTFTVAFCGFAPGFGYLTGLPESLHAPRRQRPRPRVPAGSIAIAAGYTAVYPTDSPGGWHLLGTCDVTLFDPGATPPALLTPGTRVRFG